MKKLALMTVLLLAAATLLVSCGGTEPPEISGTEEISTEDSAPEPVLFRLTSGGKGACAVIRPDEAADDLVELAKTLRSKIQTSLDVTGVEIGNDFVMPGKQHAAEPYEILVGDTNYAETAEVRAELRYLDYSIRIMGHKLVIAGGNTERLDKAVSQFLVLLGQNKYQDKNGDWWVSFEDYTYSSNYKVNSLHINGGNFEEYRIVYPKNSKLLPAAESVAAVLANATGYYLPIVTDAEDPADCEILIGNTNRLAVETATDRYSMYLDGKRMVFACAGSNSADAAVRRLYADTLSAGGDITLDAGLSVSGTWCEDEGTPLAAGADIRVMSFNILTEKWGGTVTNPRAELFGLVLERYRPDVVGIQEVCSIWRKEFPAYGGSYKMICTSLADGGENYSCILYDSDRYDVIAQGAEPYSASLNKLCRNMGWAVFRSKTGDKTFALISTHWDFDADGESRDKYRQVQADELAAKVAALRKEYDCPVFTTGDYNCIQTSKSMTYFREINKMWSSWFDAEKKLNDYGSATSLGVQIHHGGNSIDFVFGTLGNSKCLTTEIIANCRTQDISDHRPVIADIKLNP